MSGVPRANCEKCKNCKMIDAYGVVLCDYLNGFANALRSSAYTQPQRCPNYEKLRKDGRYERKAD